MYPVAILSVQSDHHGPAETTVLPVLAPSDPFAQTDSSASSAKILDYHSFVNKKTLMIAKRGSGKTWLITSLYKGMRRTKVFKKVIVVSPTEKCNPFYVTAISEAVIYASLTDTVIAEINAMDDDSLVIFDDCIASTRWKDQCDMMRQVFDNQNITVLMCCQFPMLGQAFRKTFNYFLCASEDITSTIKRLHGYVNDFGHNYDFDTFRQVFKQSTSNFRFIAFKNLNDATITLDETNKSINVNNYCIAVKQFVKETMCVNPHMMIINPDHDANAGLVRSLMCGVDSSYTHLIVFTQFNRHRYENLTSNIYTDLKQLKNVLLKAKKSIKKDRTEKRELSNPSFRPLVVLDHMCKGAHVKSPLFSEVVFNGRHYRLSAVVLESFAVGISPELRCNFDYVFMNCGNNVSMMKRLYDHYAGMFPDFHSFKQVYGALCDASSSYFVCINRGARSAISDKIAWMSLDKNVVTTKKFPTLDLPSDADVNRATIRQVKTKLNDMMRELQRLIDVVNDLDDSDDNRICDHSHDDDVCSVEKNKMDLINSIISTDSDIDVGIDINTDVDSEDYTHSENDTNSVDSDRN
ncbi:P-loop NTPase domain protein [Yasminevirus sp. GU-2018]|uniref:P-loop NTPase domain protein n=1 Tax=Yasminevirus sp. GU-2018 TaxID=2420051 RepID=A0A5K0UC64_9VIRU|nr:P-loop NTPase domain protein [Yasminevirus sp. GU-2018]